MNQGYAEISSTSSQIHEPEVKGRFVSEVGLVAFLFLIGFVFRLIRLFDLDIWFDEAVLLFQIEGSFSDIWNLCKSDNFAPLYPWMLKAWHSVFPGENSLRLFSALLGALTPPVTYLLGRELFNKRFGLILGVTSCLAMPLLYYSQMIRMYTIFPFFGCLSLIGFFRGLKTNGWKYWFLVAGANLFGFYNFLYMLFLIPAQFSVILWYARHDLKKLTRPLIAHIPTFILIIFWIVPLLSRYSAIQQSFWVEPLSVKHLIQLWFFLGAGTDFEDRYWLAALANLPFLLGFIAGIRLWKQNETARIAIIIILIVIFGACIIAFFGPPIFFKRYFLFLVPLYYGIVLLSWMQIASKPIRRAGLSLTYASIIGTTIFFYTSYLSVHSQYVFTMPLGPGLKSDGHSISKTAEFLENRILKDEVIVHYSSPLHRSFGYFPMLYYHQRKLPEYIISAEPIPDFFGGQYLKPGERIGSVDELDVLPMGIWIVSLDSIVSYSKVDVFSAETTQRKIWFKRENFLEELRAYGFKHVETVRFGRVSNRYYRRPSETVSEQSSG